MNNNEEYEKNKAELLKHIADCYDDSRRVADPLEFFNVQKKLLWAIGEYFENESKRDCDK